MQALPAYAASMWTHNPYSLATSQSGPIGSTAVDEVVPTVGHKKSGTSPDSRSLTIAAVSDSGDSPKLVFLDVATARKLDGLIPAICAAFWSAQWVWSEP
ncbi:hypothetical protein AAC387_Pa07g3357 [Persea americana]